MRKGSLGLEVPEGILLKELQVVWSEGHGLEEEWAIVVCQSSCYCLAKGLACWLLLSSHCVDSTVLGWCVALLNGIL